MQRDDFSYWQSRTGERGGARPERGSLARGVRGAPYGGGWLDPENGYSRDTYDSQSRSAQPFAGAAPGPFTGLGPRGYQRSDERIRDDVCEALTRHGHVDASEVDVSVENGEVTLRGTVTDRRQKRTAEDALDGIVGIRDVHNQLRVHQGDAGQAEHGTSRRRAETGAPAENGGRASRTGRR